MKNFFLLITILFLCATSPLISQNKSAEALGKDNMAYKWGKMAITATANNTDKFRPRPIVTSRMLGLTFVAV